tara:strand:+ start:240 stop:827 length:588 start_codon:yes stop_codon:yes gene_type:complete
MGGIFANRESLMHIVLWRRLDREGHDVCRYSEISDGWNFEGVAVFDHAGSAANLSYSVSCDRDWRSRSAAVSGWIGETVFNLAIEREHAANWRVNGTIDPALAGLDDIDLGFTPASNTNAIRRMNLSEGAGTDCVAVWLDTEDWAVKRLPQSYHRIGQRTFAYVSPQHDYRATLVTDEFGVVVEYPGLWTAISRN